VSDFLLLRGAWAVIAFYDMKFHLKKCDGNVRSLPTRSNDFYRGFHRNAGSEWKHYPNTSRGMTRSDSNTLAILPCLPRGIMLMNSANYDGKSLESGTRSRTNPRKQMAKQQ
jgi:hypothetical protein